MLFHVKSHFSRLPAKLLLLLSPLLLAMILYVPLCRYQYSSNNRTRGVPVVEEHCSLEGVERLAESSQVIARQVL